MQWHVSYVTIFKLYLRIESSGIPGLALISLAMIVSFLPSSYPLIFFFILIFYFSCKFKDNCQSLLVLRNYSASPLIGDVC